MLETVKFPVGHCPTCDKEVLLAGDLDERGELIDVCVHCGTPLSADVRRRQLGAATLAHHGYDVEGEREQRGCGTSGGCGETCGC